MPFMLHAFACLAPLLNGILSPSLEQQWLPWAWRHPSAEVLLGAIEGLGGMISGGIFYPS